MIIAKLKKFWHTRAGEISEFLRYYNSQLCRQVCKINVKEGLKKKKRGVLNNLLYDIYIYVDIYPHRHASRPQTIFFFFAQGSHPATFRKLGKQNDVAATKFPILSSRTWTGSIDDQHKFAFPAKKMYTPKQLKREGLT